MLKSRIPLLATVAIALALSGLGPWAAGAVPQTNPMPAVPPTNSVLPPLEWISIGIGAGGCVQEISAAPSRPDRMYVGVDVGGLYISDDGGLQWRPIYAPLTRLAGHASRPFCIAVSHQDPDVFYFVAEAGPFTSRDGGRTYRRIGEFIHNTYNGQSLCINPADDRDAVFFYASKFLRTRDGGQTLAVLPLPAGFKATNLGQAFYPPGSAQPVLVIGNGEQWFRSMDGASNWVPLAMNGWPGGLPVQGPENFFCPLRVSFDKTADKPLLTMPSSKNPEHVYRSADLGDQWRELPMPPNKDGKPYDRSHCLAVFPHPTDPDTYGLTRYPAPNHITRDGGKTWFSPTGIVGESPLDHNNGGSEDGRSDLECMGLYFTLGAPGRVYVMSMFYVRRSDDGGKTFALTSSRILGQPNHYMSTGIEGTYMNVYAADPNTGYRYLSDDDCGVHRSEDFCRSWFVLQKIVTEPRESGHYLAGKAIWNVTACATILIDAAFKPSRIYAWFAGGLTAQPDQLLYSLKDRVVSATGYDVAHRSGLYASTNHGADFLPVSSYKNFPYKWRGLTDAMVLDPQSPKENRTFWTAVAGGVFKSVDGGRNWTCLNERINKSLGAELPAYDAYDAWEKQEWVFGRVRLDPSDSRIVYVHLIRRTGQASRPLAPILKSIDGGETWAALASPVKSCSAFEVSPLDSQRLYAACIDQGVFGSNDGGKTWDLRFPLDPARGMVVCIWPSRRHRDLVFFGVDAIYRWQPQAGVFRSADNGKTWLDVTGTIPHLRVMNVREDDINPRYIYTGTMGGGGFLGFDRLPMPR